ncbi:hypothetical protein ICW40_19305 [Actinotalea ferrariae]|uniref:hypothetical protein n=1 Tax=Actinotalea ferrariae TaxID=1386098 RepID=UPI001C8BA161|nr:hypothetical protein [Actinotalea ferrariae]MBX9246942.1 hypothetical protein [Actinotalea ferrariae]
MPSYRAVLAVGRLAPGTDPATVLPAAVAAARAVVEVEAWDVGVVRGEARATVRYVADDDDLALGVARRVRAHVAPLADVVSLDVSRRYGPRWYGVRG